MDADWGHLTIKIAGHPPFGAQILLNGHEYVACQARRAGVSFSKEGNCFTGVSTPAELARVADTLSEVETIGRLSRVSERWITLVSLSAPAPAFAWLYRIVFASLELALYVLVLLLAKADDRVFSRLLFLTFLPLPLLATVVWAQEEILAAVFIFLGLISWHKERPALAIVIWSFGVVGGKVYILPLLVLGLAYLIRTRMYGPVFLATAIVAVSYAGRLLGGGTGFEGFLPENFFTNTLWAMLIIQEHIELRTQFHVSAALCGVWGHMVGVLDDLAPSRKHRCDVCRHIAGHFLVVFPCQPGVLPVAVLRATGVFRVAYVLLAITVS